MCIIPNAGGPKGINYKTINYICMSTGYIALPSSNPIIFTRATCNKILCLKVSGLNNFV